MNNTASKLSKLENVQIRGHIENWFNELNRKNRDYEIIGKKNKTQETYESEIRFYFFLMCNKEKSKELEYLSMDDIEITQEDYEAYIEKLCAMKDHKGNNKYVNKTINKKTSALKSMLKYLKRKKVISIDISYLSLFKGEKVKKNSYEVLESDQVLTMADLCLDEKDKGYIKQQLILLTFKTGFRLSEALSLKWSSFIEKNNEIHVVGIGKGNKPFDIKIPRETYSQILTLNQGQEYVFDISDRGVSRMMDRLRDKMGLQDRNIVFHSIRKAYGTLIWRMTGDIEAARRALRHESVVTTQIYLGIGNYEAHDTIFSIEKISEDTYKNVNYDDLILGIESLPKNLQLILNLKLHELKQNK